MVKECTKCGQEKPLDDFYVIKGNVYSKCKPCQREAVAYGNRRKPGYKCPDNSVYAIHDREDGRIVYIGSSSRASRRLYLHFESKMSTHHGFRRGLSPLHRQAAYDWSILWSGEEDAERIHKEKTLIYKHKPIFNKIQYVKYNKEIESSRNRGLARTLRLGWVSRLLQRFKEKIQNQ